MFAKALIFCKQKTVKTLVIFFLAKVTFSSIDLVSSLSALRPARNLKKLFTSSPSILAYSFAIKKSRKRSLLNKFSPLATKTECSEWVLQLETNLRDHLYRNHTLFVLCNFKKCLRSIHLRWQNLDSSSWLDNPPFNP